MKKSAVILVGCLAAMLLWYGNKTRVLTERPHDLTKTESFKESGESESEGRMSLVELRRKKAEELAKNPAPNNVARLEDFVPTTEDGKICKQTEEAMKKATIDLRKGLPFAEVNQIMGRQPAKGAQITDSGLGDRILGTFTNATNMYFVYSPHPTYSSLWLEYPFQILKTYFDGNGKLEKWVWEYPERN